MLEALLRTRCPDTTPGLGHLDRDRGSLQTPCPRCLVCHRIGFQVSGRKSGLEQLSPDTLLESCGLGPEARCWRYSSTGSEKSKTLLGGGSAAGHERAHGWLYFGVLLDDQPGKQVLMVGSGV